MAVTIIHDYRIPEDPQSRVQLAIVKCPKCGRECGVGKATHSIAADGTVMPSMICPHDGCDFHEYVTLFGWSVVSGVKP